MLRTTNQISAFPWRNCTWNKKDNLKNAMYYKQKIHNKINAFFWTPNNTILKAYTVR